MTCSLRTRLIMGTVGGVMVLLIVSSIVIYGLIRRALTRQFDASLLSTARMLAGSVEEDEGAITLEVELEEAPEFQNREHPTYYQLWQDDGSTLARSPSLGTDNLLRPYSPIDTPIFRAMKMKNGQPGRSVAFQFRPRIARAEDKGNEQPAQPLTLLVARDAGELFHNLRLLQWLLIIVSAGTATLSVVVAGLVVRQGLKPLNFLAGEIASIREDNLSSRIAAEPLPIEILPIRNRLNELLSRLEASFNRERRFAADVAHELRTPLAGIRSTIEVTLAQTREPTEYQAALSDCLAITRSMQAMVNNLLMLTRIDSRQTTFRREQIRPAELVDSCWGILSQRASERDVTFANRIPAEMTCHSDPDGLSMVFSNLMENALEYANENGQIWSQGRQINGRIEIIIANTGCRLTQNEVSQVFDCFWRGDQSRTDTGIHCGLGLALVQRIITALGGSAAVELQQGGIFTMRLVLPA